jgi:hypothetical protein
MVAQVFLGSRATEILRRRPVRVSCFPRERADVLAPRAATSDEQR